MMGQQAPAQNELFYDFNLESRIPSDHLLRKIDEFLDLDVLRTYLQPFYSHTGRPSVDPELMIRMLLVGYCYGIRSERRLCEEVNFNLAYRWFCRMGLEDEIPNHSTFSKNRHGRFRGSETFRYLFETVVTRCMAEGLVKGEGFAIDASELKADVCRQNAMKGTDPIDWGDPKHQARPIREYLEALDTGMIKGETPKSISLTDPMSRYTGAKGRAIFAYSTNYMIDVSHGIILDVEATPAHRIAEVDCTQSMLERIESKHNIRPRWLAGDTAYGVGPNLSYLVTEKGIEPHIPVWDKSTRDDGTFSISDFEWHAQADEYRCPGGKSLGRNLRNFKVPRTGVTKANTIIYRARQSDCKPCPWKANCCPNTSHRKIERSIYEEAREVARKINQDPKYINETFHERKKVEMLFGHMKRNLNFQRLRLRGMKSVNDECTLVATVQNLRRLVKLRDPPHSPRLPAPA